MDAATARLVLYAITGAGVIAWAAGLWFLLTSRRPRRPVPGEHFDFTAPQPQRLVRGSAEVDGEPAELAAKAAAVLAKGEGHPFGPLKILERSDDHVAFEGTGSGIGGQTPGRCVHRGQLRFTRARGGPTCVDYTIEVSGGRGLLWGGAIAQGAGLVALIVGFWLIRTHVVPNPAPDIRAQTFQMFQVVHFLWPPFLFAGLYRRAYRVVRVGFDTLVHNLPYFGD